MSRGGHGGRKGLPGLPGVSVPADRRFRRADPSVDRRRRATRLVWRLAHWLVPALALVAVLAWVGRSLVGAQALRVRDISVQGNSRLSTADVELLVDGIRSENILQVDFEQYEHRLLESPWVADVTLFRALPARVGIRIVERTPLAIARIGQLLYLVDGTGVVIDEYTPMHRAFDLPIVDGLVSSTGAAGPLVDPERARLAHALVSELAGDSDLRKRLSQIDVSKAHNALVMIDDDPAWLHLGQERFAERLRTYLGVRPSLLERFREIDYVDLRFDGRVYLHGKGLPSRQAR
jgi:cell division septal protein FtsQ